MKMSKRPMTAIGCLLSSIMLALAVLQIIFLTMKLTGAVSWSLWTTLIPTFCVLGLPLAIIVIAVIVLAPKVLIENRRRRKRLEAEAKMYGMARQLGESDADFRQRIVRRNMLSGDYTRKEVKDMILKAFPTVGSCRILISNRTKEVALFLRPASTEWHTNFTDYELGEIAEYAAKYIPIEYTVIARNEKVEEVQENGNTKT